MAHTPALLLKLAAVIQQEKCVNNATRRSTLCSCASVARLCVGASGICLSKSRSHSVCSIFFGGGAQFHLIYIYEFASEINLTCV